MTLFEKSQVVGSFLGFSEGGLEFHADLILPYRNYFQSSPMHGQFVLVALENDAEAIVGRITTISAQGRLVSPAGEDYALRQQREDRPVPEDLRDQFLKYRVNIRILGVLRSRGGDKPPLFVPSHRRLPHVGAKVAFLSGELLRHVAGAAANGPHAVELGFLALGEFVYAGTDARVGNDERLQVRDPAILPRFDILHLVSRRSFVFARAGFGKSNLVKLLFANLYGGGRSPVSQKRSGWEVPVGTVIFDPDGEYYWPDDPGRPGLCDVPALRDRLAVFTDKEGPSDFYRSFSVDKVRLDIRELDPAMVISLVIPAERQEHQNVAKLKQLRAPEWSKLVDEVWLEKGGTDLRHFYRALRLDPRQQENEALAARSNMVRVVTALHDPSSQLLRALIRALSDGKLCVVDISQMRGPQGLALAGVILQRIFEHNQAASGGQPVAVSQAVDATETFKTAAIRQLARDEQFRAGVRTDRGVRWGFLQHKLAGFLPGTFGQDEQERSDWVYRHGLVKRALNEILGENGWRSATRDGSHWVTATAQVRSSGPPAAGADTS